MKLNFVRTTIATALSFLISYAFYNFQDSENKILLSVGSFVLLVIALVMTLGASFELPRTTTNIRVASFIFFTIGLISNLIFAFLSFFVPIYIVINGILLLMFILIIHSISKVNQ